MTTEVKTTVKDSIKEKLQKNRALVEEGRNQETLEKELGPGVEKVPPEPEKPELDLERPDFTSVLDMRTMVEELSKLPDVEKITKDFEKYDNYEAAVRKLWVIKQSDHDSWKIRMRVIKKKDEKTGRIIWQRGDDGKYLIIEKVFNYNPITIQEKDDHYKLLNTREDARQELLLEAANMRNMTGLKVEKDELDEYRKRRPWIEKTQLFQKASQDYYIELFRAYFAAEEDEIERILFDDIMNYVDVALYKEQVRSPK